jgi:hypothetical protein
MNFNENPRAYDIKDVPNNFALLHYPTDNRSMTVLRDFGTDSRLEPFNTDSLNCEWTKTSKNKIFVEHKVKTWQPCEINRPVQLSVCWQ